MNEGDYTVKPQHLPHKARQMPETHHGLGQREVAQLYPGPVVYQGTRNDHRQLRLLEIIDCPEQAWLGCV